MFVSDGCDYEMRVQFVTAELPFGDAEALRQHLRVVAESYVRELATLILNDHETKHGAWAHPCS